MMKAMVINRFGDSSVFEESGLPVPEIAENEVLIAVRASSVNPVDWKIRAGKVPQLCPQFPAVLHPDCAGVIANVGGGVTNFAVGDEVYAFASGLAGKQGALAEFMPADARMVALKPGNLSFVEAATLPLVAVTSWLALLEKSNAAPGSRILIQGGTGGVGSFALQLAKARFGDEVFATCGTKTKCDIARSLGARDAFLYHDDATHAASNGLSFDVIFNTAGQSAINQAVDLAAFDGEILDINGTFPTSGAFQFKALSFKSVFGGYPITHGFDQERIGRILENVTSMVEAEEIRPLIDPNVFSFSDIAAAHDHLQDGNAVGKIALKSHFFDCTQRTSK